MSYSSGKTLRIPPSSSRHRLCLVDVLWYHKSPTYFNPIRHHKRINFCTDVQEFYIMTPKKIRTVWNRFMLSIFSKKFLYGRQYGESACKTSVTFSARSHSATASCFFPQFRSVQVKPEFPRNPDLRRGGRNRQSDRHRGRTAPRRSEIDLRAGGEKRSSLLLLDLQS